MSTTITGKSVWIFLAFTSLLSAVAYALVVHNHHETPALSRFVMWCPGFAALCTCLLLRIPIGSLGWTWPAPRFLRLAYVLPLLYVAPVYLLTWLAIHGSFSLKTFEFEMSSLYGVARWPSFGAFGVALPLMFTVTVIGTCTWTLGEELGWRGFLFPRLYDRFGFHGACLISGAIWAVWHYPGLLWADYNAGTNPVFAVMCFTILVIALGYILGYLRRSSSSLWPCVLLHSTHNTFVQALFDPLTAVVGPTKYITTEFGVGLAIATVATAILVICGDFTLRPGAPHDTTTCEWIPTSAFSGDA